MNLIYLIVGIVIGYALARPSISKRAAILKRKYDNILRMPIKILRKDQPITENERTIGIIEKKRKDIRVLKK